MSYGFSKSNRLNKEFEFQSLRSESKCLRGRAVIFFYRHRDEGISKIGLKIPKKFGKAVFRNRIKRIIREEFRQSSARKQSISLVITVNWKGMRQFSETLKEEKVKLDLKQSFKKLATR